MFSLYFIVASAAFISQANEAQAAGKYRPVRPSQAHGDRPLDKLARDLMGPYTALVYPGGNVSLTAGYSLVYDEYDEATNVLSSQIWERYTWKDPRLAWNPEDYDGISVIRLPARMVWIPDIRLYTSYGQPGDREDVNAAITNDGTVTWIPPAWYMTRCRPSMQHQGTVNCTLKFGSWTYDGFQLALSLGTENDIDLNSYVGNDDYDLTSQSLTIETKYYACCTEPYSTITAKIGFEKRRQAQG
jgi:hypothetical protein